MGNEVTSRVPIGGEEGDEMCALQQTLMWSETGQWVDGG